MKLFTHWGQWLIGVSFGISRPSDTCFIFLGPFALRLWYRPIPTIAEIVAFQDKQLA